MEIDAEKLIVLVEQRPAIYNFTLKDHHNKDLNEKLWAEVANEVGNVTSAQCKAKWNVLRSSYSRHMREMKKNPPSGSAPQKKKTWYLANSMSFLENFVGQHRPSKSNAIVVEVEDSTDGIEPEISEEINEYNEEQNYGSIHIDTSDSDLPPHGSQPQRLEGKTSIQKKKRKMTASEMVAGPMINFLKSRSQPQPAEPVNANIKFFESLVPDMEKLSTRRQRDFKLKVLSLLNKCLDEQENEQVIISNYSNVTSPESSHSSLNPDGHNIFGFQSTSHWNHFNNSTN